MPYPARYLYDTYGVRPAVIGDSTWVSEGVRPGAACVSSLIPRRAYAYAERIRRIAAASGVPCPLEVEDRGGSDAQELQRSDQP